MTPRPVLRPPSPERAQSKEAEPTPASSLAQAVLDAATRGEAARRIRDAERSDPRARAALVEELAGTVLRLLRVDARRALAAAERQALVARGHPLLEARALWSRAHALTNVGRREEAADHYARASSSFRRLGEPLFAARTALGHVDALMYLGRYKQALAIARAARPVLLRHRELRLVVGLDSNLANILHRLDRPDAALRAYDRALRSARRLGDAERIRGVHFNRANVLVALGRFTEAEDLYQKVRSGAGEAGESWVVALVDYSLGYLCLQRSDYGPAYALLDAARSAFEALGDSHQLALGHLDLAELLLEINRFERAEHHSRRARALCDQLGLRYENAKATLFSAIAALGQGEDERAKKLLAEATTAFRQEGNAASEAVCELYGGEIQRRGGRPAEADTRFARAERCFGRERLRLRQAAATLRRAGLAVERGRRAQARAHLAGARRILHRLSSPWLTAQHDHLRGRLDLLDGRPRQALGHLNRAVEGIEGIRSRIGLDEFSLSFAADKAPIYADLVEVLLKTRSGARAVSEAFAVVERARARALVDLLAGRLGGAETHLDPAGRALVKRLARLRGEVSWLSGLCSGGPGLGAEGRRDESQLARSREMLLEREADIADTTQRLARRHQGLGALAAGETITLDEVQSYLTGDTALIEYYLNGDRSRAFVIHRDSARVVDLSAAADEIEIALGRLRFQIDKCGYGDDYLLQHERLLHAGARHHLGRLAELVWDPLGVESQRIVIVPHGPLHSLPFHALPAGDGLDLVDRAEITCLPSASTLRYLRRAPGDHEANGGDSILVVGVEDHRIPKVREEVEQLEQLFPHGRSLRGPEATLEALSSAAAEVDYLHVAAHGIFRQDDPFFSALRLADGWLSLYDIYGLQLKARLVSLSACQSGRSWVGGGDEMVGLVRGFLYAGASSLVVSLWPVHDSTTAELMSSFYRSLRAGELPASALRTAMIEVRATHPHPYHWAPFVLIGPGREMSSRPQVTDSTNS